MAKSLILQETRVERSNFVLAWGRLFEVSWLSLENFLDCLEQSIVQLPRYFMHSGSKRLFAAVIERFSNKCRKTKTKVIIPANHNKH